MWKKCGGEEGMRHLEGVVADLCGDPAPALALVDGLQAPRLRHVPEGGREEVVRREGGEGGGREEGVRREGGWREEGVMRGGRRRRGGREEGVRRRWGEDEKEEP